MHRRLLGVIVALGLVISAVSGMGVFATFSDTAHGGENSVTSGERAKLADLRIEPGEVAGTTVNCDVNADGVMWENHDTTTAQFTVADVQPGVSLGETYICLKNVGAGTLSLNAYAVDLADVEVTCTGDEQAAGDTTCNPGDPGELAALLHVTLTRVDCDNPTTTVFTGAVDQPLNSFPAGLSDAGSTLAPGDRSCVRIAMVYAAANDVSAQLAQTDKVTWRFAFEGKAS